MQRMDNRTERIFSMLAYRYLRNRHDKAIVSTYYPYYEEISDGLVKCKRAEITYRNRMLVRIMVKRRCKYANRTVTKAYRVVFFE